MARYFSLDHLRSSEQSFVTACDTQDEVEDLLESCSEHIIREITQEQYNAALALEN